MGLVKLSWVWFSAVFIGNSCYSSFFPVPPSHGDLAIDHKELLMISMAPDGIEDQSQLFYVCGDNIDSTDTISPVVARQLGYKKCEMSFQAHNFEETDPNMVVNAFGKEGITCDGGDHILRCTIHQPETYSNKSCDRYIQVECLKEHSLRYDGTTHYGNEGYQGEVLLFPPASVTINDPHQASVSFGLVAVKKEGQHCTFWRFIDKGDVKVNISVANTFCRHMGYTNVDSSSIMTRKEAISLYHYNFSHWDQVMTSTISVADIQCKTSHPCLGCCKYNTSLHCPKSLTSPSLEHLSPVEINSTLVIRCTFYENGGKLVPGGTEEKCHFKDNKLSSNCESMISLEERTFIAAIAVPIGVLLLICIILGIVISLLCLKCICHDKCNNNRDGYNNIPNDQDNQQQPNPQD